MQNFYLHKKSYHTKRIYESEFSEGDVNHEVQHPCTLKLLLKFRALKLRSNIKIQGRLPHQQWLPHSPTGEDSDYSWERNVTKIMAV